MQTPTERTDVDRERTAPGSSELDRDELFELLQSGRRRRAARHLLEFVGEPVLVDALATAIARREHDAPADGLDPEVRERVAVTLDHAHLPQLDAAGVVDYDRSQGSVTPTPRIEALKPYLASDSEDDVATGTTGGLALAGFAGGSLATRLALRDRTAAGLGVGLLVALSIIWTASRDSSE